MPMKMARNLMWDEGSTVTTKGQEGEREGERRERKRLWINGNHLSLMASRLAINLTPKKMVKLATRSALSDRANDGKIVVVDSWDFETPKTKSAKQALEALDLAGNVLVVIAHDDTNAMLSFRNLPNVLVIDAGELNAYDVLCSDWVVFTKASLPSTEAASEVRWYPPSRDESIRPPAWRLAMPATMPVRSA